MVAYAEEKIGVLQDEPIAEKAPTFDEESFPALPEKYNFPAGFSDRAWHLGRLYEDYSRLVSPEGYDLYHEACWIGLLSILSLRRVKIPFGVPDYTPLMTVLMAEPGAFKKTATAKVVAMVLKAIDLDWLLQSAHYTPQKLIHDMSGTVPKEYAELDDLKQERVKRRLAFAGQRGMIAGEFGEFVKEVMDRKGPMSGYLSLFLEMDDCKDEYDSGTISRSDETIKKPQLSLIGCMTPANVRKLAGKDSELWGNGFWSRLLVVCSPPDEYKDEPFKLGEVPIPSELLNSLRAWHKRLGIPHVEIDPILETDKKGDQVATGRFATIADPLPETSVTFAPMVYESWVRYRSFIKHAGARLLSIKDLRGSYERLPVKAMRIAALLASVENNDRIELWHWARAQEIIERMRRSLHELYAQCNINPALLTQSLEDILMDTLKVFQAEQKSPTIREMQQRTRKLKGVKSRDIAEAFQQLERSGEVVIRRQVKTDRYSLPVEEKKEGIVR